MPRKNQQQLDNAIQRLRSAIEPHGWYIRQINLDDDRIDIDIRYDVPDQPEQTT